MVNINSTTNIKMKAIPADIHNGDKIHHHRQSITLPNFSPINNNVSKLGKPIVTPEELLSFISSPFQHYICFNISSTIISTLSSTPSNSAYFIQ